MLRKILIKCDHCGKEFLKAPSQCYKTNFCCWEHKKLFSIGKCFRTKKDLKEYGRTHSGINNNNYKHGNSHGKKCPKCGGKMAYRAKYFCNDCTVRHTFLGKTHSTSSKKLIGRKSSQKFTVDFKRKFKQKMVEHGYWINPKNKTDYEIYFELCNWPEKMFGRDDIDNSKILKESGVFHVFNNKNGCVRDHKFSRKSGYELGVFPEILQHPCNCQLVLHKDNIQKRKTDIGLGLDNIISLEQLFNDIKNYKNSWQTHKNTLYLIEKYEQGERWKRE